MTSKTLTLTIFASLLLVLALGFTSATLDITSISYSNSISHNSDVTVTFTVAYTGDLSSSTVHISTATTAGSWTTVPADTVILNASTASLSGVLHVPAYTSAGMITASLTATGNSSENATAPVRVNVSSSPAISLSSLRTLTTTQGGILNVTNTGNAAFTNVNLTAGGDIPVSFSDNGFTLAAGASRQINVSLTNSTITTHVGVNSAEITAKDLVLLTSAGLTYTITGDFCDSGNVNVSEVKITRIKDVSSEDDWEWKPLDSVTVEFRLRNEMGSDEDFVAELGIYDTINKEFVEIDDEDTLETDVSVDDGTTETVSFNFTVPVELQDSNGRYVVFIKAYVDGQEELYCNSYSAENVPDSTATQSLEISRKSRDVIATEISNSEIVRPGDSVTVTAKLYNIGTSDETKVKARLVNTKLGIDIESSAFELDSEDSDEVSFTFIVPADAQSGTYNLDLSTYFDYKKSSDTYSKESEDTWKVSLQVVGSASPIVNNSLVGITASLDSSAIAGEEMIVSVVLTNAGSSSATFAVGASGYDSWATLSSISDRLFTLNSKESKTLTFKFNVADSASGEKTFNVDVLSGSKQSTKQVAVTIADSSWLSSLTSSFENKSLIWIIGALNLLLIILIIIVVVRVLRR